MFIETYSKRLKKQQNQGNQDFYQYDNMPIELRVQIVHIWSSAIGRVNHEAWELIHNQMCRELGVFSLGKSHESQFQNCIDYILKAETVHVLDIVELSFKVINTLIRKKWPYVSDYGVTQDPNNAIAELNHRFKEHNVGYEFVGNQIMRIDSQYLHEEVIKPAIQLLYEEKFQGASDEFTNAHKLFRTGDYKNAIVEAAKAFESTMKVICKRKKWEYKETDPAKKLLDTLFEHKLIPDYLNGYFGGLRACLESGLPTLRNKTSGHGQGEEIIEIPEFYAAYAINQAATNMVFLINAYKAS